MSGSIRSRITRSGARRGGSCSSAMPALASIACVTREAGTLQVLAHHLRQAGVVFDHQELLHLRDGNDFAVRRGLLGEPMAA